MLIGPERDPYSDKRTATARGVQVPWLTDLPTATRLFEEFLTRDLGQSLVDDLHAIRGYKFPGEDSGVTIPAIIKESHAVLTTWPELKFAEIELSTCSRDPRLDLWDGRLIKLLRPQEMDLDFQARDQDGRFRIHIHRRYTLMGTTGSKMVYSVNEWQGEKIIKYGLPISVTADGKIKSFSLTEKIHKTEITV